MILTSPFTSKLLLSIATVAALAGSPLALSVPASAQPAADAVGHWLYDANGEVIGSVRGVSADGTARVMIGSYLQPGSHEASVAARDLATVDGKVVLRQERLLASNAPVAR
jgi:hypothetical protein